MLCEREDLESIIMQNYAILWQILYDGLDFAIR